jgi:hypothetical protein
VSDGDIAFWSAFAGALAGSVGTLLVSILVVRYEMRRRERLRLWADEVPAIILDIRHVNVHKDADKAIREFVDRLVALRWKAEAAGLRDRRNLDAVIDIGADAYSAWRDADPDSPEQKAIVQEFVDALQTYHGQLGQRIRPWWRRRSD